jgi:hypothetical protein
MSKIFRRPMFRKGGNVGDGIMTGIVDRTNHAEDPFVGGTDQYSFNTPYQGRTIPSLKDLTAESTEALLEAAGDRGGFDPLTSFLLSYGPSAAVEDRGGGTIANLIAATEKPVQALLKEKADEDKFQRGIRVDATGASIAQRNQMIATEADQKFKSDMAKAKAVLDRDLSKAEQEALLFRSREEQKELMKRLDREIEGRKDIERIKQENQEVKRSPEYLVQLELDMKEFDGQPTVAKRATDFKFNDADDLRNKVGQGRVKGNGVLSFNINDPAEAKANRKIIEELNGTYVYDPYAGNYKKIIYEDGKIGQPIEYATIESINLGGVEGTGTDTKVIEEPSVGLFGQETKPDVITPVVKKKIKDLRENQKDAFDIGL